ncbi:hypothetical protein IWZ00DRAFT_460451 [Phyllosticta capitalensis]
MVSLKLLSWVDKRLREVMGRDLWLGGLNGMLVGDFGQLLPVEGSPLFGEPNGSEEKHGRDVYRWFRAALEGLRSRNLLPEHFETLSTRVARQPVDRRILRLYSQNKAVNGANEEAMRSCRKPIIHIEAKHFGAYAKQATFEQAGRLHASFPLCIGARVMVIQNLWIERGLIQALFYRGNARCTRTQFPLTIDRAVTIYKAQGATVDQVVINLNYREYTTSLLYIIVSYIRTLKGLIIKEPINYKQIKA